MLYCVLSSGHVFALLSYVCFNRNELKLDSL
jgi:hypothetical protein